MNTSDLSEQEYDIWYHEDKLFKASYYYFAFVFVDATAIYCFFLYLLAFLFIYHALQDHIKEVIDKWYHYDDEIWGKIVIMERNQRICKAYIRGPVLSINGSWDTFNGETFGLRTLANPIRDKETQMIISNLAEGIKIMKDQKGNIFLKRLCNCHVFIQGWHKAFLEPNSSSISDELIESKGRIGINRLCKLFDIEKFQQNILQELKSSKPDKNKLESQCISILAIGQDSASLLSTPCWIIVINIIAFKILRPKLHKKKFKSLAESIWSTIRRLSNSRTFIRSTSFM